MRIPLRVRAAQPASVTLHRGHVRDLCLLFGEVGPFSEAAARNAFSEDCHALNISEDLLALLQLHMCAG